LELPRKVNVKLATSREGDKWHSWLHQRQESEQSPLVSALNALPTAGRDDRCKPRSCQRENEASRVPHGSIVVSMPGRSCPI